MIINYNDEKEPLFKKDGVDYYQLSNGTVYCKPLDQSKKVGGTGESERNSVHNPGRLDRIITMAQNPTVLDYGCGSGLLVNFLKVRNVNVTGYDKYSDVFNNPLPKNTFDIVTMIEVVEHLSSPFNEIDEVFYSLKEGGHVMIETSFTDWMNSADQYINPSIGHCTIFSHHGLDELMISKGFKVGEHINRNVRIYQKPILKKADKKITLITMGQGNPIALKRTLDSFKDVVTEIVFGDLLIFEKDRELIKSYQSEYNLKIIPLPFNFIFLNGFAHTLNTLSEYSTNDLVMYMNVSEEIDGEHDILSHITSQYNCYSFNHKTDPHIWFRMYNRKELKWDGIIHETVSIGAATACPDIVFTMKDGDKDMDDEFYAKVMNTVKELVYWNQYIKLVEHPEVIGATNYGWVQYAKDSYESLKERMAKKGKQYEAFVEGNFNKFIEEISTSNEFKNENQESSLLVNLQGRRINVL